jgi:competence ComEA-like helix-hairpin-helix protein
VVLNNAKIPIIDDREDGSKGSGLMHHKFVIIDGKILIVTSANFTLSDIHGDITKPETRGNANNLLYIKNAEMADIFTEEFNEMWGDGMGGKLDSKFGINKSFRQPQTVTVGNTALTVRFSPNSQTVLWQDSSNGLIGNTLNRALNSVDLALFVFSEQNLANILQARHQRGVSVRALIDPEFAFRNYSEGLDLSGVALANKCQYEADNNPWKDPIDTVGVPQLQQGDKLHHKFGIVDRSTIIAGSHNWSAAANYQNDETLLILKNPAIASHYEREFERLYSNSNLGIPITIKEKIDRQIEECLPANSDADITQSDTAAPINLNTASQKELETLPGVGAKLAERIIQERQNKPFSSLEDLQRVPGIGKGKIKKLESKVNW